MAQRMESRQIGDPIAHPCVERVMGGAHVRPGRLPAPRGNGMRREHGALGLNGHVRAIGMPTHVALEHLDDVVLLFVDPHAAVLAHVADREEIEL